MDADADIIDQVLDELIPVLETLETRSAAILLLLKDRGMARDEQLAPYLEEAANASNVKWLAARLRMKSVLSSALKTAEQSLLLSSRKAGEKQESETQESSEKPVREAKSLDSEKDSQKSESQRPAQPEQTKNQKETVAKEGEDKEAEEKKQGTNKTQSNAGDQGSESRNANAPRLEGHARSNKNNDPNADPKNPAEARDVAQPRDKSESASGDPSEKKGVA